MTESVLRMSDEFFVARLRREGRNDEKRSIASRELRAIPHVTNNIEREAAQRTESTCERRGHAFGINVRDKPHERLCCALVPLVVTA